MRGHFFFKALRESKNKKRLLNSILVFVALMAIVYVISLWLNISAQNDIRQKIIESVEMQLDFLSENLDEELEHLFRQQHLLTNDYAFQMLALQPDSSNMGAIYNHLRRISSFFTTISATSPHISGVGIYFPGLNRVSSSTRLYYEPSEQDYLLFNAVAENDRPIFAYGDDLIMGKISSGHNQTAITAITYFRISGSSLKDMFSQVAGLYNLSIALLYDNEIVLWSDDTWSINDFSLINSNGESSRMFNVDGQSFWILRSELTHRNMVISAILPTQQVDGTVIPTLIFTITLTTATLIFSIIFFTLYINRAMLQPLDTAEKLAYEQSITAERARFKQLQSQIKPHFLYNSFYHIYRISKMGDSDLAAQMSLNLSHYYRYITRDKDDIVELNLEAEHAANYAAIQNIRFGDRVECTFDEIPQGCRTLLVPKIFLQPLLENAYVHGLEKQEGTAQIHVGYRSDDDADCIIVEDSGRGLDETGLRELQSRLDNPSPALETTGIVNICQRLKQIYGERAVVSVSKSELGGLRFEASISKNITESDDI